MTISKREYDALLLEVNSQEILIVGFQKENEKLILGLNSRQKEDSAAKAKFFDQREYLNKEINRLRNMVGEIPKGVDDLNNLGSTSSQIIIPSGIGSGTGSGVGIGVGSYLNKSADVLRAELDKDALVRHLRERAAIAESGAGVREKELQQVHASRTFSIEINFTFIIFMFFHFRFSMLFIVNHFALNYEILSLLYTNIFPCFSSSFHLSFNTFSRIYLQHPIFFPLLMFEIKLYNLIS